MGESMHVFLSEKFDMMNSNIRCVLSETLLNGDNSISLWRPDHLLLSQHRYYFAGSGCNR